jgi:hypothetical protein
MKKSLQGVRVIDFAMVSIIMRIPTVDRLEPGTIGTIRSGDYLKVDAGGGRVEITAKA